MNESGTPQPEQEQEIHARTVREWQRLFEGGFEFRELQGTTIDAIGFMLLALGRDRLAGGLRLNLRDVRVTGQHPTQEQAIDCVVGMLNSGGRYRGLALELVPDFLARFEGPALVRNTQSHANEMNDAQSRNVNEFTANATRMSAGSSHTADTLIASGLGTAIGAALQIIELGLGEQTRAARGRKMALLRNGAITCRSAIDALTTVENQRIAAMTSALNLAVASVGPLASGLPIAGQVAAAGLGVMAQTFFQSLVQPADGVTRRRNCVTAFRGRVHDYATTPPRNWDPNTQLPSLLTAFDSGMGF